jgi:antitoxin component YwqK of YwqJK toxin-antitoxin module
MKFTKYDRHGIFLLSAVVILLVLISVGCSKSNESKIVGHWKVKSIDSIDGSIQNTTINFQKKGIVSKTTEIVISEEVSRTNKIMGKYKFEDDKKNISITWNNGKSEITSVNFPSKNKMLLGKHEMEKIQ